jgi:hypothetical protein
VGATDAGDGASGDAGESGTVAKAGGGMGSGGASTGDAGAGGAGAGGAGAGAGGAGAGGTQGFDAEDGLVAHFPFDEASGSVFENRKDPGRSATCSGTCTHPDGRYGGAVGIRNLPINVDWVDLPSGLLSGLSATTLSLWVRDLSTNRKGGRLLQFSGGDTEEFFFTPDDIEPQSSRAESRLAGSHRGEPFVNLWTTGSDLTDEDWHHVAITWSATSIRLYIDGRALGEQANPGVRPSQLGTTERDYLGRTSNNAALALYAEIDEFRIYDKALSSDDVARLYDLP